MRTDQEIGISLLREGLAISDETIDKLMVFEMLLRRWQTAQNLVSRETLAFFWQRHVCDSAALYSLVKQPAIYCDLGSGAGFPGLVIAILQAGDAKRGDVPMVYLVESNQRKAAFLRSVVRETGCSAVVVNERVENVISELKGLEVVSARALAPLKNLIELISPIAHQDIRFLFHKGRDIDKEIADASNNWRFDLIKHDHWPFQDLPREGNLVELKNISQRNRRSDNKEALSDV